MTTQARQLPIAVPLVRAETISSYLNRIAKANHLNPLHLASCLSTDNRRITRPDSDRLDLLTGHPAERLTSLIVGLDPSRSRMKSPVGTLACRRCMAQRGIVHDVRRVTPDLLLCQRHRRWTGDVEIPSAKQYDLTPVPDVVCAQRRHHHLLRLHGGSFRVTFQDAKHIHHRWTERGDWPGPRTRRLGAYFDLQQWRIPHVTRSWTWPTTRRRSHSPHSSPAIVGLPSPSPRAHRTASGSNSTRSPSASAFPTSGTPPTIPSAGGGEPKPGSAASRNCSTTTGHPQRRCPIQSEQRPGQQDAGCSTRTGTDTRPGGCRSVQASAEFSLVAARTGGAEELPRVGVDDGAATSLLEG